MADWESEDFEVTMPAKTVGNKWEGEDEEEDVKDSWDDPEDEKKEEEPVKTASTTKKSKSKTLNSKIEEKERKAREEWERKLNERQAEMTPEEKLADKLRRQQLEEEADLIVAKELLGTLDVPSLGLDTQEDFDKFKDDIINKLGDSTRKEYFPIFVELLVQSLCVHLSSGDLKKLATWLSNLHIEKLKMEKGDKSKKNKGKGKAKLKMDDGKDYNEFSAYTEDYDDFM